MPGLLDTLRARWGRNRAEKPAGKRRYEGGAGGRRWQDGAVTRNPNADALAGYRPIAARARHAVQNNGLAAKAAEELVSAIVGGGFSFQSLHPDETLRAKIEVAHRAWSRAADIDGRTCLDGLIAQAVRGWVVDGEGFIRFTIDGGALRLMLLDPDQVDPALHRDLGGGRRIVAGVEFDEWGRRAAYHVLTDPPGQPFATIREPVRVPASEIIHLYTPLSPGQVRGVSWFAPVLLKLKDHDGASDALLVLTKIASCMVASIVKVNDGEGIGFPDANPDPDTGVSMLTTEPGAAWQLAEGEDIRWNTPPRIGEEMISFLKWQAREIAAGLGVPYESMTGDLEGVNYSSIRAGTIDFRRRIDALRRQILEPLVLGPVWRRWLTVEALAGRLPADAVLNDFEAAAGVEIIPPGWSWVDPAKEIAADRDAVDAGFKSRREVVAARGRDIDTLDAEIAADNARAKSLNLSFGGVSTSAAGTPPAAGISGIGMAPPLPGGGAADNQNNPETDE